MRTKKGQATQLGMIGTLFAGLGALMVAGVLSVSGDPLTKGMLFMAMGLGMLGWVRATLPTWARTREEQMEGIAERIPRLMGDGGR